MTTDTEVKPLSASEAVSPDYARGWNDCPAAVRRFWPDDYNPGTPLCQFMAQTLVETWGRLRPLTPGKKKLMAIADGRHEVIDKATHTKITHEELDRLRGAVTALKEELRDPELGVRIAIETIFVACAALDAAQQEEGNE